MSKTTREAQHVLELARLDPVLLRPLVRDLIADIREARDLGRTQTADLYTLALQEVFAARHSL